MSVTNAELTKRLFEQQQKYKDLESFCQKEIQNLKAENSKLLKNNILSGNVIESKHKEVLRLSAFGYAPGNIHQILTSEKGINISLKEVQLIVDKIELLPTELYRFYLECKQDFKDKVTIDGSFFKSAIYKKYMLIETVASAGLSNAREVGDDILVLKYTDQLVKLYDKMSQTFFKNGIDMGGDNTVDDLMSNYDKNKDDAYEEIGTFNPSKANIKVV